MQAVEVDFIPVASDGGEVSGTCQAELEGAGNDINADHLICVWGST